MTEEKKFGISPEDQAILDRLKSNRDSKFPKKEDEPFEPVIKYGTTLSDEQKKEKQRETSKKHRMLKKEKADQAAMESAAHRFHDDDTDTNPQIRGSMSPKIEYNGDDVILTWTRTTTCGHIQLPEQIQMGDMVELRYNTKDRVLTVISATLTNLA